MFDKFYNKVEPIGLWETVAIGWAIDSTESNTANPTHTYHCYMTMNINEKDVDEITDIYRAIVNQ